MTTLDSAPQSSRRACDERRDPREVFREFLDHLGHTARRRLENPAKTTGVCGVK